MPIRPCRRHLLPLLRRQRICEWVFVGRVEFVDSFHLDERECSAEDRVGKRVHHCVHAGKLNDDVVWQLDSARAGIGSGIRTCRRFRASAQHAFCNCVEPHAGSHSG